MAITSCPHCQAPNPDTARFCGSCGGTLPAFTGSRGGSSPARSSDSRSMSGTRTHLPTGQTGSAPMGTPFGTRYRLLEKLGKGGMGEVWKARDLELDQLVALKMIRPDLLEEPELLDRFKQEITLARKVTHKNVTRIYDLGEVEGTRFISMEYLEGVNLKEFIRQEGPLPEEKAIPIMREICDALKAAHEAGIVHRDLKPQNVLIDPNGHAHIMDFGIAFSGETSGLTRTGALIGTPEYMSPEQVRGERLDNRSDIYSLGLILYEMVTADLPFTADSAVSSMYKRLSERPRKPREVRKDIPTFLEKIILRCLEKEKAFRYADVGEILADIQEKHAPARRVDILVSRLGSRVFIFSALGVAVTLGLALVIFLLLGRPKPTGLPFSAPLPGVAFLPFENQTGSPGLDWTRTAFPALISHHLGDAREVRLLGGDRTQQTLQNLRLSLDGSYTPFDLRRAASVLGADILVTGTLRRDGDRFQAEARLLRPGAQTKPEVAVERSEGKGEDSVFQITRTLAEEIGRTLKVRPSQKPGGVRAPTRSVEALRLYSQALELTRSGQDLDATKRLEEAVEKDPSFAMAHALLSRIYARLGQRDRALSSSEQALKNLGNLPEHEARLIRARHALLEDRLEESIKDYRKLLQSYPQDSEARFELGEILERKGDLAGAAEELQKCLSSDPKHSKALYSLGRINLRQGDTDAALKIFSELLGSYTQAGNDAGKGNVLLALGNVHLQIGRPSDALSDYRQSLEILTKVGDRRGMMVALGNIANVLRAQGQYAEAIQTSRQAIELGNQIGDQRGVALQWGKLGEAYEEMGQILEAQKCYQESLKIVRNLDDPALLAKISSSLGYVSSVLGNYGEAYLLYREALAKRREIGDKQELLRSLIEMGLIEQWQGHYDKALGYAAEATGLVRETGESAGGVVLSTNVGMIHDDQGSYGAAIKSLNEAVAGARKIEDKSLLASALLYLGGTLAHVGQLAEADDKLGEAARVIKDTGSATLEPELLSFQAEVRGMRRDLTACLKTLAEGLRRAEALGDRRLVILTRVNLGHWSLAAGKGGGKEQLTWAAEEAGKLGLVPLRVRALSYLASLSSGGTPGQPAVTASEQALREGKPPNLRESLVLSSWILARHAEARGDHKEALRLFLDAGRLVQEMAQGLEEPSRSALLARADLSKLSEEAAAHVARHGSPAEKETIAAAFRKIAVAKKP